MNKFLYIILVLNIITLPLKGQVSEADFAKANDFFENNQNIDCINLLQKIENQIGANPKIYSLYIKSYLEIADYTKAAIALNKFKKIVCTKSSPAISEILALEKEIIQGLEKEDQEFLKNGQQKQQKEADQIIQSNILLNINKKNKMQKSFQEYTLNKLSKSTLSDIWESLPQMTPSMVEKALSNLDKNGATWLDITKELRRVKTIKSEAEIRFIPNKKLWNIGSVLQKSFDNDNNLTKYAYLYFGIVNCENCPFLVPQKINNSSIEEILKIQKPEYYQYQTIQNSTLTNSTFQIQKIMDEVSTSGNKRIKSWVNVDENKKVIYDSSENITQMGTGMYEISINTYETEAFPLLASTRSFKNYSLNVIREKKLKRMNLDNNTYSFVEIYEEPTNNKKKTKTGIETFNKIGDVIFDSSKLDQYEPMKSSYKYSYDLYGNILWREWTNNQGVVFRTLYIREYHDGYIPPFHPYEKMKDFTIN